MILLIFFLFVLLLMMKMSVASGHPLYGFCYRLKFCYDKKSNKPKPKRFKDKKDKLLPKEKRRVQSSKTGDY